jgi:hypothetical protein
VRRAGAPTLQRQSGVVASCSISACRLSQLSLGREPIVRSMSVFGTTLLVQFIGSPGDVFATRFQVGRFFLIAGRARPVIPGAITSNYAHVHSPSGEVPTSCHAFGSMTFSPHPVRRRHEHRQRSEQLGHASVRPRSSTPGTSKRKPASSTGQASCPTLPSAALQARCTEEMLTASVLGMRSELDTPQ